MSYCRNCGTELSDNARFCPNCGAATTAGDTSAPAGAAAAAAPAKTGAEMPATEQLAYAGLGRRIVAHLLDGIIILFVYVFIGSWVAAQTGDTTAGGFELHGGPAALVITLTSLIALLYFSILESRRAGKTAGKALLGIRVADAEGGKAGFGQALGRNLLRIIDGLVFYLVGVILILTSDRYQRLGDRIANTVVLRGHAPGNSGNGRKANVRFSMGGGSDFIDT